MTDDEREAQKWAGDEAKIRSDHEQDRARQPHLVVSPYQFAVEEILLLRLDEARAELARKDAENKQLRTEIDRLDAEIERLKAPFRAPEDKVTVRPAASAMGRATKIANKYLEVDRMWRGVLAEEIARAIEAAEREAHAAGVAEGQRQMREAAFQAAFAVADEPQPKVKREDLWPCACGQIMTRIRAISINSIDDTHSARIDALREALGNIDTRDPDLRRLLAERNLIVISDKGEGGDAYGAGIADGRRLAEPERRDIARIARKQMREAADRVCSNYIVPTALREAIRALPDEMDPEEYPVKE